MNTRRQIQADFWGGLAAMLVALPASIAYGVATYGAIGPDYVSQGIRAGLIGAVVLGLVAAVIDGAPRLISAPSAPAAAVLGSVAGAALATRPPQSPSQVALLLGAIALLAGLLQAVYGLLGGGRLIKYIPYPVVAGYLSAVGVMIFVGQIPKFLGFGPTQSLRDALLNPSLCRAPAVIVGTVSVLVMALAPRVTKRVPAAILALLAGMGTYLLLAWASPGLRSAVGNSLLLGPVSNPLTDSAEPGLLRRLLSLHWSELHAIVIPALTLSVLLSVDSLKTCVIVDALTFTRHDSNRTLLGQGIGNALTSLAGGMPGSGTMGATLVNVESGGRSRLSGVFEAVAVVVAVLAFDRWLAWVPMAALAGILIVVAVRMFDWSAVHLIRQRSTILDFLVIAAVVGVAVATNLIVAAGVGVGLAMLLFIRDQSRGSVVWRKTSGQRMSSKQHRLPVEQDVLEKFRAETTVCELQGSLFFGTTDQLFRELERDLATCRYLILDLRRVQSLDYTAAHLFGQFEAMLASRNGWLLFSRLPRRRELREYLTAHSATGRHPNARAFETLDDALQWAEDEILREHLPGRSVETTLLDFDNFELTRDLDDAAALAELKTCAESRHFAAGDVLFRAGDPSDELFLVRAGVVRVTLPLTSSGYHTLASFGRGHFFGEMAFLVRGIRSANATATTDVDVFVISRRKFDALSRRYPAMSAGIFSRIAQVLAVRLRRTDAELRAFYDA